MTTNSLNINSSGVVAYNATTGVFAQSVLTQFNALVAGAGNAIVSVAPSATAGVPFISSGAGVDPAFGTAVVAGGGTGLATLTAYELLAAGTTATGSLQQIGIGSAGQVLTSNGAGALASFQAASVSEVWVDVVAGTQTIAVNTGYITDNATVVTYTLPASPAQGSFFKVMGGVSGSATIPWTIAQPALQQMILGSSSTTVGVGGSLSSTLKFDAIEMVCIVGGASAVWSTLSSVGNFSIV